MIVLELYSTKSRLKNEESYKSFLALLFTSEILIQKL
jgi:hypothetical protein